MVISDTIVDGSQDVLQPPRQRRHRGGEGCSKSPRGRPRWSYLGLLQPRPSLPTPTTQEKCVAASGVRNNEGRS
jgi:hypothetical protein